MPTSNKIYKVLATIIVFGCFVALAVQYFNKYKILSRKASLQKSSRKKISNCIITSVNYVQKSSNKWINYTFNYKDIEYKSEILDVFEYKCTRMQDEFNVKKIPVVFDSINPENNFILFHKRDFVYFGYLAPDSMNWLFNCIDPHETSVLSAAPVSPN